MIGRDFRRELAEVPCWDRETQALYERHGEALRDCALQNREELIGLCEFVEREGVRSYLEIGTWTGRTVTALHRLFRFDRVAVCDDGYARRFGLPVSVPPDAHFFEGDSRSDAYRRWREEIGHVDLVMIDADHSYRGVRVDFEINRAYPYRFLAFHDIAGADRRTAGVRRFWVELTDGSKREILRPHSELGLDHSTMGIGIWSASGEVNGN
jgi:hypothetical protein